MRKDINQVLRVVAAIRESPILNRRYGGLINFYFDARFSEDNLRSVYSRSNYNYGGPLGHGEPPFRDASDRFQEQEETFVTWFWTRARLQMAYNENDKTLWSHVEPLGLVIALLRQIILDLLLRDAILAVVPIVAVFSIV